MQKIDTKPARITAKGMLDAAVLTALALFATAGLGYLFYGFTVYFILPIAVWISPTADRVLSKIGDDYDPDMIYNSIRGLCLLIALFPGMHMSNRSLKTRERSFLHDTGGTCSPRDGLKYHINRYFWADAIAVLCISLGGIMLCLFNLWKISPFYFLYHLWGIPLGLPISVIITAVAQFFGMYTAQNGWRTDSFYGG